MIKALSELNAIVEPCNSPLAIDTKIEMPLVVPNEDQMLELFLHGLLPKGMPEYPCIGFIPRCMEFATVNQSYHSLIAAKIGQVIRRDSGHFLLPFLQPSHWNFLLSHSSPRYPGYIFGDFQRHQHGKV